MSSIRSVPTATAAETIAALGSVMPAGRRDGDGAGDRMPFVRDGDERAVRTLKSLRERYGAGPLLLRVPLRPHALVLSAAHVRRVLDETPEPFAEIPPLGPPFSLGSQASGTVDAARTSDDRRVIAHTLDSEAVAHREADAFLRIMHEEARALLGETGERGGQLTWGDFITTWRRAVRRVVLGHEAGGDEAFAEAYLRAAGARGAVPRRERADVRQAFLAGIERHLDRAEDGSLAFELRSAGQPMRTDLAGLLWRWLFAFEPAGLAAFRALALLATHDEQAQRARREAQRPGRSARRDARYLRACVLESLRLWPAAPLVTRRTTRVTEWDGARLRAGTVLGMYAPFFHRDPSLSYADRFAPDIWLEGDPCADWPLIPFSSGLRRCPARNLVLLLSSAILAEVLDRRDVGLVAPGRLDPTLPLPMSLDDASLRLVVSGRKRKAGPPRREGDPSVASGAP